jgi:hypothetical protein
VKVKITDADSLLRVQVQALKSYLLRSGYRLSRKARMPNASVWQLAGRELLVPDSEDYADYPYRIAEVIAHLAGGKDRSELEIYNELVPSESPQARTVATGSERLILELLSSGNEMFGLDLVEASGGRLKRASIHVTLQGMASRGLVKYRKEEWPTQSVGISRDLYAVTDAGRQALSGKN